MLDAARKNDKRPAYMQFIVPDEFVKNFYGSEGLRNLYFLVMVPREFYEKMK